MPRRHRRSLVALLALLGLMETVAGGMQQAQVAFDLIIRNARIVDGAGNPWFLADLAVRGDGIARIATRIAAPAQRTIDAGGRVLAPGFIDIHSHARRNLFEAPTADSSVRQGVTTLIEGPDGSSPLPIRPFLEKAAAAHLTPNLGTFVGQGSIRDAVIGSVNRPATSNELEKMRELVRTAMADGAFGLSTGLFYVPGTFTSTEEVIELARVAGVLGGIHISHMREETSRVAASVRETIEIGEKGALPTQVTHHKVIGTANWGRSVETLRLVDEARARGVDTTIDVYPYTASATGIAAALLPAWAQEGGTPAMLKRLKDAGARADIRNETMRIIRDERGGGDPQNVQLSRCEWDPSLDGKRLGDITRARGVEPTLQNAAETALWLIEQGNCGGIFHAMDEQDLQRILRHPAAMIASDSDVAVFGRANPHPRAYGTFVRVLGRYVRELKVLTLEDAVRKMTSLPAQRLGLGDRGVLREGLKADLTVFDPSLVRDRATFDQPHQYAEGVSLVVVNGEVVFENGAMTGKRPGRVLYGPAKVH
jgi:N-acyl-D-amino-acid deacylase